MRARSGRGGIPLKQLLTLCAGSLASSVSGTMLFSFVGFMVESFGLVGSKAELGYYAGYLASAFFLSQFFTAPLWGAFADRYGRRPAIVVGLVGGCAATVFFGFSKNYAWALTGRIFGGSLTAQFSLAKTYMNDITTKQNRADGFSYLSMAYGIGSILGPMLGGFLSQPAEKNPSLFAGTLFETYPFALCGLVAGSLIAIAFVLSYFFLPETLHRRRVQDEVVPAEEEESEAATAEEDHFAIEMTETEVDAQGGDSSALLPGDSASDAVADPDAFALASPDASTAPASADTVAADEEGKTAGSKGKVKQGVRWQPLPKEEVDEEQLSTAVDMPAADSVSSSSTSGSACCGRLGGFCSTYNLLIQTISWYSMVAFAFTAYDELFPLFAMTPPPLGLDFDSTNIGLCWTVGGVSIIAYQAALYPRLAARFGTLTLLRMSSLLSILGTATVPNITYLTGNSSLVWAGVVFCVAIRSIMGTTCFTSMNILVNNSVASGVAGKANGIAFSLGALVRAIGPALGGNLLAWTNSNGLPFPLDFHFVWLFLALCQFVLFLCATFSKTVRQSGIGDATKKPAGR